uniref:Tubulin polyglutamylase TTLL4 n=1 Tax=Trichobilharzia regenti TaxID=157069 RepID=A0AA85KHZ3_TRIRE|nr:unnamed protein product [Trichobilharzia regenti]
MKKGVDSNEDFLNASERIAKGFRPRSPFIYNKSTEKFALEVDREILKSQYEKSYIPYNSRHYLAKFIRPVSLATLKSLSDAKLEDTKTNISCSAETKKIQPIYGSLPNHLSGSNKPADSTESDWNKLSRIKSCRDKRNPPIKHTCCNFPFKLVNDEQTFLYSTKSLKSGTIYRENHLCSDLLNQPEKVSHVGNVTYFRSSFNPPSCNFKKPCVTSSLKITADPPAFTVKRMATKPRTADLLTDFSADLFAVDRTRCSRRDKMEQKLESIESRANLCMSISHNKNSDLSENFQMYQSYPAPNLMYKKIKQDFEVFKKEFNRQLKVNETFDYTKERSLYFENKEGGGVLEIANDGYLHYATPVSRPFCQSAIILSNQDLLSHKGYQSEANNFRKFHDNTTVNTNIDNEHPYSCIQRESTSTPLKKHNEIHTQCGIMEVTNKKDCRQRSPPCSKSHPKICAPPKQVEIDSGNGTDEDDHIANGSKLLDDSNNTKKQKMNKDMNYSQNSEIIELEECFLSDNAEDDDDEEEERTEDSDETTDDERQSNEEASVSPANSYSESLDNPGGDNHDSAFSSCISKTPKTSDEKIIKDKVDHHVDSETKVEKLPIGRDANTDLCVPLKTPTLRLSTFAAIAEKHSKLSVTSYHSNTTTKDIISTNGCESSVNLNTNVKNDQSSIVSQSPNLPKEQNLSSKISMNTEEIQEMTCSMLSNESQDKAATSKPVHHLGDTVSHGIDYKEIKTKSKSVLSNRFTKCNNKSHPALIDSLFPYVPPVLRFVEDGQKLESLPWEFRRLLKWRASLLTPIVVKQTLQRTGFRASKLTNASEDLETVESSDWIFYFGKHMRPQVFRTIKMYQKVNHLPCSFQLGRKDRLWRNIIHMQVKHGKENFNFMPQTYCLPGDLDELKKAWDEEGQNQRWIMKPPASARGIGVRLVTKWSQIPKKRPALIQRYLSRPFLINDSKFDLRIYVYISSINPLRLYIHEDGLVRFASQKYSNSLRTLGNRFIHLTNYSINRLNSEYISNSNEFAAKGHKWSLRALWTYLKSQGISPAPIWSSIKDVVVKTVISTEAAFNTALNVYCNHSLSVNEIFGFDIFLDEDLRPWLLEVNVSPSMHSDSPLDAKIKGGVIKDMLNISGLHLPEAVEAYCRTIIPSCSSKCTSNTPDPIVYPSVDTSDIENNFYTINTCNPLNMEISDKQFSEGVIIRSHIKSANDVDSVKLKHTKSHIQRPNPPSHRWLLDERLFIQLTSSDEREKRKYYKARAVQYGLPVVNQVHAKRNSSTSLQCNQKYSNKSSSSKSSSSHDSDTTGSLELSSSSSDTGDETETVCSPSPPICETSNNRGSSSFSSSSSSSPSPSFSAPSRKSARSMGIGPSSPDFKLNRPNEVKESVNKIYSSRKESVNPKSSVTRISPNNSKGSRCKSSICYKNSDNPHLTTSSSPPAHILLASATNEILDCLTPSDVRILISMVDELERAGGFHCVFPPKSPGLAAKYLSFFESPRYANLLCIAYLQKYGQNREKGIEMLHKLCEKKIHIKSSVYGDNISPEHCWQTYQKRKSTCLKELIEKRTQYTLSN